MQTATKTYSLTMLKRIAARHGGSWQEAYEKALAWVQEGATDHEWWDTLTDEWKTTLDAIGFENADIRFSGFWSQGDGASFTSGIDATKLVNFLSQEKPPWSDGCLDFDYVVKQIGGKLTDPTLDVLHRADISGNAHRDRGNYYHDQSCTLYFEWYEPDDIHELGLALLTDTFDRFTEAVERLRIDLCRAIYNGLEQEYEYLTSEEACLESAEANDWRFDADGAYAF
jgi:hypothetical protein